MKNCRVRNAACQQYVSVDITLYFFLQICIHVTHAFLSFMFEPWQNRHGLKSHNNVIHIFVSVLCLSQEYLLVIMLHRLDGPVLPYWCYLIVKFCSKTQQLLCSCIICKRQWFSWALADAGAHEKRCLLLIEIDPSLLSEWGCLTDTWAIFAGSPNTLIISPYLRRKVAWLKVRHAYILFWHYYT